MRLIMEKNIDNQNIKRIIQATDEEAALIYLYRCLDERGKGGVMNCAAFAYTQLTRNAILQNQRKATQVNREEDHNAEN